jgi:hypothetical protein
MDGTGPEAMTRDELERVLQVALEELEEVNEKRQAVLGQTGVHIGVVRLRQYELRFARDQQRLEDRCAQIRSQLAVLEQEASA